MTGIEITLRKPSQIRSEQPLGVGRAARRQLGLRGELCASGAAQ